MSLFGSGGFGGIHVLALWFGDGRKPTWESHQGCPFRGKMMLSLLSDARQHPQQHPAPPPPPPSQHPPPFGSGGGGVLGFLKGSLGELEEASDLLQSVDGAVDVKCLPRSKSDEGLRPLSSENFEILFTLL